MTEAPRSYPETVDPLREALEEIVGLTSFLRQGGPDPMDLQGLSNALDHATSLAHAALAVPESVRGVAEGSADCGEVAELRAKLDLAIKGIRDFTEGNYDNPRQYRPEPCKHGQRWYEGCQSCDDAFMEQLASSLTSTHEPAQGLREPVMWVCLVPGLAPAGAEIRIRAWTADRKRMESLRAEGLDMQPLYTGAQGSGDCGAWQPISTAPFVDDLSETDPERILVWVQDGGSRGKGAIAFGYAFRGRDGSVRLKADGYMGFKVTIWRPLPAGPALPSTDREGK